MFIELTNASEGFEGYPISINSEIIVTIFQSNKADKGQPEKLSTFVFSTQGNTWEVQESVEEVVKLIKAKK